MNKENSIFEDIIRYIGYIGPFIMCFYILHSENVKQNERIDKVYEILLDIVKEGKKL